MGYLGVADWLEGAESGEKEIKLEVLQSMWVYQQLDPYWT